jgi:hypothetical protein
MISADTTRVRHIFPLTPTSTLVYECNDLPSYVVHAGITDAVGQNSCTLMLPQTQTRNTPMRKFVSLCPAREQPALPVLPARSWSLARPNC